MKETNLRLEVLAVIVVLLEMRYVYSIPLFYNPYSQESSHSPSVAVIHDDFIDSITSHEGGCWIFLVDSEN